MNDIVEKLKKVYTATVSDALIAFEMDGRVMCHQIRQIVPGTKIVGPAFTLRTSPGNVVPCIKALKEVRPGEVIVIDTGRDERYSYLGEDMSTDAKNAGAVGIVIDGLVRDVEGIIKLDFPIFARGVTPMVALYYDLPGKTGVPITCGGCVVEPGDIIHGDGDGVAVIPAKEAQRIAELAQELQSDIDKNLGVIRRGKRISEFAGAYEPPVIDIEKY